MGQRLGVQPGEAAGGVEILEPDLLGADAGAVEGGAQRAAAGEALLGVGPGPVDVGGGGRDLSGEDLRIDVLRHAAAPGAGGARELQRHQALQLVAAVQVQMAIAQRRGHLQQRVVDLLGQGLDHVLDVGAFGRQRGLDPVAQRARVAGVAERPCQVAEGALLEERLVLERGKARGAHHVAGEGGAAGAAQGPDDERTLGHRRSPCGFGAGLW